MCVFSQSKVPARVRWFFLVFLLRESRCKVQTVPLSPSYTGYKRPLVCPLEPALKKRQRERADVKQILNVSFILHHKK